MKNEKWKMKNETNILMRCLELDAWKVNLPFKREGMWTAIALLLDPRLHGGDGVKTGLSMGMATAGPDSYTQVASWTELFPFSRIWSSMWLPTW